MALEPGKKLGPYEILSPIGKGGMGEVYRARDTRLDRDVAIKVLPEATSKDEQALSRFTREAKAVAALSHPNILAIYDVGESDGIAYVVTELLEGETLRERLTRTQMAWRQALEFAATIADGLAAAHAKGIIHRDLKPENVFLTNDGVVKILDFGLARMESPTPSTDPANTPTMTVATAPGAVMGTIHYMSPEQVRGLKTDAQSDIFSFGCVLYEMVSGERAFQGKTAADTMTAILREEPESVSASVRGVGPELDRLVVRCLDKKPERRFHSASDLAFTLRAMLSDSGSAPPVPPPPREAKRIGGFLGKAFVAGLILVVGFLGWREWSQTPIPAGGPIRRIAVLALENRSGDPDQEVYADAMTEAITDALAQISALHVISPRAMLRLKGTDLTIPELAKKLNVDAIVDASRIQIGNKIQVRARLVEGATERQIWSDHYERDVRDVFAMQNEIALAIAEGVKVRLTPTEQAMLADAPTIDPPAYDLYVEGLDLVRKNTEKSMLAALSLFDRALEIDPGFARAHAGRAGAYSGLASTYMHPREALPQVEQAAKAALALDPNLPEAHVALGNFELLQNWNWDGAEVFYQRALDINPSHSAARLAYALYLTSMKRFDEAKHHLDRVQESDPDAKQHWMDYGGVAFMSRDYARVVRDSLEALRADPGFWPALQWLGLAREQLGQMTEAIHDLRKAHQIGKSPQVAA
ncbi:MAG: protein kinase, partial [Planctomycetes bacterium]|nr:protein kinase [Planctomycetota bacterium]